MSAAELLAEAEDLRRRERLLARGLPVAAGPEQRRLQLGLLRQTRAELAPAERACRAVEAGWEPFQPSPEWFLGYLEDPRCLRGRITLVSVLIAAAVALFGILLAAPSGPVPAWWQAAKGAAGVALPGWLEPLLWLWHALGGVVAAILGRTAGEPAAYGIGDWLRRLDLLPAMLGAVVVFLGLQAALNAILGRIAFDRDRARLGEQEVRIFNAPMPAHAALAYRRARESGLFDSFTVHSPWAEDFRAVAVGEAPSLGLLDPVLAGHIGRHSFLIAQWDLAKDLMQV